MIIRDTNIKRALKSRQKGFLLNPFRFGSTASDFPVFQSAANGTIANSNQPSLNMPSGIVAGDVLVGVFLNFNSGSSPPSVLTAGWTTLISQKNSGTFGYTLVFTKVAVGGDTVTITNPGSEQGESLVMRFNSAIGAVAAAASASTDPPNLIPPAGSDKYLWLAGVSFRGNQSITATPTNYIATGLSRTVASSNTREIRVLRRELEAASENPSSFTLSGTTEIAAFTVAIT